MASIEIAEAEKHLAVWLEASRKLARGEVARVGDQRLDRANWEQVQGAINYWRRVIADLKRAEAGQSAVPIALANFSHRP